LAAVKQHNIFPANGTDNSKAEATNPLKTKLRLLYLKTQFVPRCKHFSCRS